MAMPSQGSLFAIFKAVDSDGSGHISASELQRALSNGTWTPFNPETCRLMISMFDSNKDGGISFTEFHSLYGYINQWSGCFRSFDKDGSGNIDINELTLALQQSGYRLSTNFVNLLMLKFDRTQTRRINFDDFIQLMVVLEMLTASFRDKDKDRDGVITVGFEEFLTMVFTVNM